MKSFAAIFAGVVGLLLLGLYLARAADLRAALAGINFLLLAIVFSLSWLGLNPPRPAQVQPLLHAGILSLAGGAALLLAVTVGMFWATISLEAFGLVILASGMIWHAVRRATGAAGGGIGQKGE